MRVVTQTTAPGQEHDAGKGAAIEDPPVPPELVILTGMSGAGRSTASRVLEDLGWYVVDNLPPQMLAPLADLAARAASAVPRLAVVVDVRGRSFFTDLKDALEGLTQRGIAVRIVFLEATDAALVRRFESVRRPHPLQADGRILDGIARERELVGDLRGQADLRVDTSDLNVHQLAATLRTAFAGDSPPGLRLTVMSFGFKYGIPVDADNVADVRFLPNPHWVPELRASSGLDEPVRDYVLSREGATEFLDNYVKALAPVLRGYVNEDKRYATVAIGCTGGKHRSVAMTEKLATLLAGPRASVHVVHRDLGRE